MSRIWEKTKMYKFKNSMNHKQDKLKENHTHVIIKLLKNNSSKILTVTAHYTQENNHLCEREFHIRNHGSQKTVEHLQSKQKNSIPSKLSFGNEGKIKVFSGEGKPREFLAGRYSLEEILEKVLQLKRKIRKKCGTPRRQRKRNGKHKRQISTS